MSSMINRGPIKFGVTRDSEGHRTYKITYLVQGTTNDGPASALSCPGLPAYGARWEIGDDLDLYAYRRWDTTVSQYKVENEPGKFFGVEMEFSTKPITFKFCKDTQFEDPLLEPNKISGSYVTHSEEATADRFGRPIHNSAHEQMRGAHVEFDQTRAKVTIEQNVINLQLGTLGAMVNTVNDRPLWGMPYRSIKLSSFSWEKKFYGNCSFYYTRKLEFDIRADGFDRDLLDEGTKVLNGHWDLLTAGTGSQGWILDNIDGEPPDPTNPEHFIRFKDRRGENAKVILNGSGKPADSMNGRPCIAGIVKMDPGSPIGAIPTGENVIGIYDGGSGYISVPEVFIYGDGIGAKATATIGDGKVQSITVTDGGQHYFDPEIFNWPNGNLDEELIPPPPSPDDIHDLPDPLLLDEEFAKVDVNLDKARKRDGKPAPPKVIVEGPGGPGSIHVEFYSESDFLLLGIPLFL